jgi:hypothetical protein
MVHCKKIHICLQGNNENSGCEALDLLYAVFILCKQSCTKSPIHLTSWKLESTCKTWCSSPLASHRRVRNETTANKGDYSQDSTVSAIDGKL